MRYIDLETYLQSEKTIDDLIDFMYYVKLVGYKAVADDAWSMCCFKMMRHDNCDCSIGTVDMWSYTFSFDDGYFEMISYKPTDGSDDYMAYWYMLRNDSTVYGTSEYVKFPDNQREWCTKQFENFIKHYYEHKPGVVIQDSKIV